MKNKHSGVDVHAPEVCYDQTAGNDVISTTLNILA